MKKETLPQDVFEIADLDALRTIANPLRAQVFDALIDRPQTVKQVAELLGLAPSKLYYHINTLEKHGFIRVVEKRVVGNIIEKLYRAISRHLDVAHDLLTFRSPEGRQNLHEYLGASLDLTREDLMRSLQARAVALDQGAAERPRQIIASRAFNNITESQAEDLRTRLEVVLKEFDEIDNSSEEVNCHTYALSITWYPRFYYPETTESSTDGMEDSKT